MLGRGGGAWVRVVHDGNQQGCDWKCLYCNGCAIIAFDGRFIFAHERAQRLGEVDSGLGNLCGEEGKGRGGGGLYLYSKLQGLGFMTTMICKHGWVGGWGEGLGVRRQGRSLHSHKLAGV